MDAKKYKVGDRVHVNRWTPHYLGIGEIIGVHSRKGYAILWETETLDDVREGWWDGDLLRAKSKRRRKRSSGNIATGNTL